MAYQFDQEKYKQMFDSMFGAGAYDSGISQAQSIGTQIGQAKLAQKQMQQQKSMLEAAQKAAALKERERQKALAQEQATGKKQTVLTKQIQDKTTRLQQAGVDTSKPQSAIGKFLNLNPDNNVLQDALDLMTRPIKAVDSLQIQAGKNTADLKKQLKDGKITEQQYYDQINKNDLNPTWIKNDLNAFMDGLKGNNNVTGADVMKSLGVQNKVGQFAGGLGLDMVQDPMNLAGGLIGKGLTGTAKLVGKGASKLPGADHVTNALDNIFVGNKLRQATLNGGTSNDLLNLERQMENSRLYMQDKSKTDVAKAMLQGGPRDVGTQVGKVMEGPLIAPKPLDITSAPNVMNTQKALDLMNPVRQQIADPMKPLGFITNTTSKVVDKPLENGVLPTLQQRLDWGSKGLLDPKVDLGSAGVYKGGKVDLGSFGTWSSQPQIETAVQRMVTSGAQFDKIPEVLRYHPKIREAAQTLMNSNADLRNFAAQNGININDLEGYMAHYVTKETRQKLEDQGIKVSNGTGAVGGNEAVNARNIHDSVRNANEKLAKQYSDKGIQQFFNPDAFVSTAGGQQRMINYVVHEATKNKIIENPDFAKALNAGEKARKGNIERVIDGKRYELTKGANVVMTNFERHTTDESVNSFAKAWDGVTNLWKKSALFSVGFHARNALGNAWNMHLAGMNAADLVKYNAEALHSIEGINARAVGLSSGAPKAIDKTYEEFLQQGLKNTGHTADYSKNAENQLMSDVRFKTKGVAGKVLHPLAEVGQQQGAWNKVKQAVDAPFQASRQLGDAADEVSRFALFKWAKDQGMSAEEAAKKVRETLFDYTQLTEAERKVFRRVAPFYTWTRKNAEFQVKAFMKDPSKFNNLNKTIQNGYATSNGMDQNITPDYMKSAFALPIPGTDKLLSANLPASDLNNILDPAKLAIDSLNPLMKVPLELKLNTQTLNGAPIQKFAGETANLPIVGNVPVKAAYAAKNLLAPIRNMSGAKELQNSGSSPLDVLLKMSGGDMAKKWNQDSFQNQKDWVENQRLQDLITKTTKQDGKKVDTIAELNKKGVYTDPEQAKIADSLTKSGYNPKQVDLLMSLRNKVYNSNQKTAAQVAQMLVKQGVPPEIVQMLTKDYLKY